MKGSICMKRVKRIMAICVSTTLALSSTMVLQSSAEGNPTISVSSPSLEAGQTGTITVTMENNPGIIAWRVLLDYDSEAIEITNFKAGEFDGAASGPLTADPFTFSWGDSIHGDYTTNGTLAEISFKVKEGAKPGDYDLKLSGDPEDFFNSDFDDVNFTFGTGKVTVKEPVVDVSGLKISPTSKDFEKSGESFTIVPTVQPENATNKNVTYKSSNEKVATVDASGKVTAVKEGSADITVTTEDGNFTEVCKVSVAHEHSMTEVPAKVSTCKEQGNNKYYKCDDCGKYFKDSEGKTETSVEAEKLPLAAHSFTKQDASEKYLKSAATCTSKAVYYYSCEVCGEKGTETFEYGEINKTNHVGDTEIVGAKAATCDEDGYTGDKVCKNCGEIIEKGKVIPATGHTYSEEWSHDAESHWRECTVGCGTIIDKAAHTGGEATCVKKAVCDVCGTEYGEINPENHKGETEIRGYVAPTVEGEGYTGDTYCLDCGEMIKKGEVLPPHVHQLKKVEAVAATHFATGNIEYYICEEDEMKFADAEGTMPLTDEEIVIPVIPHTFGEEWKYDESKHWHECECGEKDSESDHTFGEWTVVTAATEEAEGSEERECTACGFKETRSIKKLEPSSDSSDKDPSNGNSNSSEKNSSKDSSSDGSGNSGKSNNSGTSPAANSNGNTNPKTGVATSATALGVLALGALVVSKKKK